MTVKIAKSIPLPKNLLKSWKGSQVLINGDSDTLVIKRVQKSTPIDLRLKLRKAGKLIRQKDIGAAIRAARR